MSNTGGFFNGQPALTMYAVLLQAVPARARGFINHAVDDVHQDRRHGYEPDVEDLRDDRRRSATTAATTPPARSASSPRSSPTVTARPQLRKLTVPTTVIHGAEDKLVRPSGGRATAQGDPRRAPGDDRRHGPRSPARRLAADHRRDRRHRRSRRAAAPSPAQDEHDDEDQAEDDAAGDGAALPLAGPVAGVRLLPRVAALGRLAADPVVVVSQRSSRPISSTIVEVAVHAGAGGRRRTRPPPRSSASCA